jgi:hypothetical protein
MKTLSYEMPSQIFCFKFCGGDETFSFNYVSVGRDPEKGGKSKCWWNYMGGYMLQVTL